MKRQDLVLTEEEALTVIDEAGYAVLCFVDPDGRPVVECRSSDYIEKGKAVIEKLLHRVLIYKLNKEIVSGKHGL